MEVLCEDGNGKVEKLGANWESKFCVRKRRKVEGNRVMGGEMGIWDEALEKGMVETYSGYIQVWVNKWKT